jgi:hypothetical protein
MIHASQLAVTPEKAARKCIINTSVAFIAVGAAAFSNLLPSTIAFLVSSITIHIACLAALLAPAWLWLAGVSQRDWVDTTDRESDHEDAGERAHQHH